MRACSGSNGIGIVKDRATHPYGCSCRMYRPTEDAGNNLTVAQFSVFARGVLARRNRTRTVSEQLNSLALRLHHHVDRAGCPGSARAEAQEQNHGRKVIFGVRSTPNHPARASNLKRGRRLLFLNRERHRQVPKVQRESPAPEPKCPECPSIRR